MINNKIDFIITWVDDTDEKWIKEKEKYSSTYKSLNNSTVRYRDWNQLKYWFRGIEKYAYWVNKIYFVTCGQKPIWLNTNHPKLILVNHKDYIPEKYLPTFSSHPIELNFHRIKGLSNNFVYFNDDMFIINKTKPEDFFKGDLPCDNYAETILFTNEYDDEFQYTLFNDSKFISKHFKKKDVVKKNIKKIFCKNNRLKCNVQNLFLAYYDNFSSFSIPHLPSAFNKKTFEEIWKIEPDFLDSVCKNKFRKKDDVNQYIFRYWQLCSGNFYPQKGLLGESFIIKEEKNIEIKKAILSKKYKTICLNDSERIKNFEKVKNEINTVFEKKFSEKSTFEI